MSRIELSAKLYSEMLSAIDFRNVLDIMPETRETYCGFDLLEQRNSEQALTSEKQ